MSQQFDLSMDVQSGAVVLRTAYLHVNRSWEDVRELIGRLLGSACVESLALDRENATATVQLRTSNDTDFPIPNGGGSLRAIAYALRRPSLKMYLLGSVYSRVPKLLVRKLANGITAGTIVSQLAGRVRLQHPLIRGRAALAKRVQSALAEMPGIEAASASFLTGSVLVLFRHGTTTANQLLAALESLVNEESVPAVSVLSGPPVSHWVAAGGCLALAVGSEFFIPGAAPLTATALVAANLPTLGRGLVELCTFRWRVSSLYTVIMGTTLVSGQFLAAALMQAAVTGWHGWTTHRLRRTVRELESCSQLYSLPNEASANAGLESPGSRHIFRGTTVRVPVGAVLPFDGVVVRGTGDVNEHFLRGNKLHTHCDVGDQILAGSELLKGDIQVKVVAVGAETQLSTVRRTIHSVICDAVGEGGATPHGKAVAAKFVPWTFATGSAALLAGDVTTLAAVLRPDFCTGPSLNDRLGTLTAISHLLHDGWLVKNCRSLHELAAARTIVVAQVVDPNREVDADPAPSRTTNSAPPTLRYQELSGIPHTSEPIQLHEISGTLTDCVEYVQNLRGAQSHIAVVAGQPVLSRLATEDLVRISVTPGQCLDRPYADIVALHGSSHQLEDLLRVVHEAFRPGRNAWSIILTCNALAIGGACLAGLTSLHVVFLTNVGALAAGLLYNRHLKRSDALLANHGIQKATSSHDVFSIADSDVPRAPPVARDVVLRGKTAPPDGPVKLPRAQRRKRNRDSTSQRVPVAEPDVMGGSEASHVTMIESQQALPT